MHREESSGPGHYYRYESIQAVSGGQSYNQVADSAMVAAAPTFSPLLLGLAVLAGAYVAVAARLASEWEQTK